MIDRSNLPLLVTLALGVFAGALDLGVLSPALPALAHTFAIPGRDVRLGLHPLPVCDNDTTKGGLRRYCAVSRKLRPN
jgi:MFS family permease